MYNKISPVYKIELLQKVETEISKRWGDNYGDIEFFLESYRFVYDSFNENFDFDIYYSVQGEVDIKKH